MTSLVSYKKKTRSKRPVTRTDQTPEQIVEVPEVNYSRAGARFWHSMTIGGYLSLLARNKFRITFLRWGMAFLILLVSCVNTLLVIIQSLFWGRSVRKTELEHPPIFVVGHWRSGTTLLHELLSLDDQHAFPSTYECFAPKHFLLTGKWIPKLCSFCIPSKRPMDSMDANFDAPQEDEFALIAMGAPSPYFRMAFPNEEPPYEDFYAMKNCNPEEVSIFDRSMTYFFKALTLKKKRRLVLKSPTHTGRIEHLSKLFPGAKFIHIARNPHKQLSSTMQLWQIMDPIQCFQFPTYTQREMLDYSFEVFHKMYDEGFLQQIHSIPQGDRCEVRFEDLIADPKSQIEKIYSELGLSGGEQLVEKVEAYFASRNNYKSNKHELSDEIKEEIAENCKSYMSRYSYLD